MKNFQKNSIWFAPFLALSLVFISSCAEDKFEDEVFVGEQQALKDENLALWELQGITDYRFTFNWSCFFCDPYIDKVDITVIGGVVDSISDTGSGEVLDPDIFLGTEFHYRTVDGLFDWIQDAIDSGTSELGVIYNPDLGFPEKAGKNLSSVPNVRKFFVNNLERIVP